MNYEWNEEAIDLDLDVPMIEFEFNENPEEEIIHATPAAVVVNVHVTPAEAAVNIHVIPAEAAVNIHVTPAQVYREDADDDKENNERAIHYAIQNFTRISATNHSSSVSVAGFPLRDKFARLEKVDWSKLEHLSGTKRIRTQRINDSTN